MNATDATRTINKNQTSNSMKRSRSASAYATPSKHSRTSFNSNQIQVRDYFLHERPFADVKVNLQQQSIWCDKALLAAASPVLCEQLLKLSPKDQSLTFDDIELDEFLLMLEFIYPVFNPEINDRNISTLIKLSHRFRFDVLKHACQFYVMKYLSTIRHVSGKCQHTEVEGDSLICNHINENTNANNSSRERDLIEFADGTCVDAYGIVLSLCQWLRTYFYEDETMMSRGIVSVLQQISVENLERIINGTDMNEEIKVYIYKERAEYLEDLHQIKHVA